MSKEDLSQPMEAMQNMMKPENCFNTLRMFTGSPAIRRSLMQNTGEASSHVDMMRSLFTMAKEHINMGGEQGAQLLHVSSIFS